MVAFSALAAAASAYACCLVLIQPGGIEYLGGEGVFFQRDGNDCGAAALKMIFDRFGIPVDYGKLLTRLNPGPEGAAMLRLKQLAEAEGLLCRGWRLAPRDLAGIPLPAILFLRRNHFVVMESQNSEKGVLILDPRRGRLRISVRKLLALWPGETLLFCKPGEESGRHGRWFIHSRSFHRRNML
jgi:ABC-type bacteriocin/lantibiotic exporter with double-glycine peptidase domain